MNGKPNRRHDSILSRSRLTGSNKTLCWKRDCHWRIHHQQSLGVRSGDQRFAHLVSNRVLVVIVVTLYLEPTMLTECKALQRASDLAARNPCLSLSPKLDLTETLACISHLRPLLAAVQERHETALGLNQYMVDPRHTGNRSLPIRSSCLSSRRGFFPPFFPPFFFPFFSFFSLFPPFSPFFSLFFSFFFFLLSCSLFRQSGILSCFSSSVELCVPYTPSSVKSSTLLSISPLISSCVA